MSAKSKIATSGIRLLPPLSDWLYPDPSPFVTVDKKSSPKIPDMPDKIKATCIVKPSELEAKLEKANAKLVLLEKEKAKAIKQAKKAHKSSEEAISKLKEAKRVELVSEAGKLRANDLLKAEIEANRVKEEKWHKELVNIKNDLLFTNQKLLETKDELWVARNEALLHANDAKKSAEAHAQKVKSLSDELVHLKSAFDSRVREDATKHDKHVSGLKLENERYQNQIEELKMLLTEKDDKYKRAKQDNRDLKCVMGEMELHLSSSLKRSEKLEKEARLNKEAESEIRESLIDKENQLKKSVTENDELRKREMDLSVQVEVLSNLLEQALAKNNNDNNKRQEEEYNSEKEYDVLPKWTSFMQTNGKMINGEEEEEDDEDDFSEGEIEMWESLKVAEKDSDTEENDAINGVMKKKKPLLGKIGSLLKKRDNNN